MSKKKDPNAFQVECRTEPQWKQLTRREGLIVVDVYASWSGPCLSILNFLRRIKGEINDSKLTFATACSDKIDDLLIFRDQSEPTWLFLAGGGKPVRVIRGCHVPNIAKAIKEEFEHELLCMEGKARRNLISIDDEQSRRKKFESEAQRLADMLKDEERVSTVDKPPRKDSSAQLETIMSAYTIAVIQPFIQDKIDQITKYLTGDFKVLGTTTVNINDDSARKLYRIPYEVDDPKKDAVVRKKMVPVVLPNGVLGDTTFLLLESTEIKKLLESGGKPTGAMQTADDWLRMKVGPRTYEQALEHSPNSLHATYGKGEYLSGVWCPRRYDDKRYILLNYFPDFLLGKVLPVEASVTDHVPKRYLVFIFVGGKGSSDVMTHADVKSQDADIFAHAKKTITADQAEKMAKGWQLPDEEADEKKKKLLKPNLMCLSINARNEALVKTLQALHPVHFSMNPVCGAIETAALFPKLNAKYEADRKEVLEKFVNRQKKRIPGTKEDEPVVGELI